MHTPFLPLLRPMLAAKKHSASSFSLPPDCSSLQTLLKSFFPDYLLSQSDDGDNSRERVWTKRLTFWTFLWQILHPSNSCRQAVHHAFVHAGRLLSKLPSISSYGQARARLLDDELLQINKHIIQAAQTRSHARSAWRGWSLKVVDGSSSSMPDTPKSQKKWPQPTGQTKGVGFPVVKWVGLFCLGTGVLLAKVTGNLHQHELPLFQKLWEFLQPGDLVVADRGFSSYPMYALCQLKGVAAVFRLLTGKKIKNPKRRRWKKTKRLGSNDHLVHWKRPYQKPDWMTLLEWEGIPDSIQMRFISFRAQVRGFREQEFIIATTLLDSQKYPAQEIIELYQSRWKVEGLIRQLKTVMKMEILRCQSPELIEKEMIMHRIAYNLVHCLILETCIIHEKDVFQISYAGTLSALQAFTAGKGGSKRSRWEVYNKLISAIAREVLPHRPGRNEPRAVKRRPKPYALLTKPRHQFKEISHRSRHRKNNNLKK